MKANKKQTEELRNVKTKSHGGKKMRKKKTIIKKKARKNKVVNILKDSVSFREYLAIRNERLQKQEEEANIPKHPCITCRYFVEGRCEQIGRPITEPLTTKCFNHSLYPKQESVYLAYERTEADIIEFLLDKDIEHAS